MGRVGVGGIRGNTLPHKKTVGQAHENSPPVSVIIPHWNGIDILSECLQSLKKTTYVPLEIIVVDNNSTDGSQTWMKENHPDVILVENEKNYGYAGGCNRGIPHCSGDYVFFLNNDTIQDEGCIEPLVETMMSDSSIAAVQPKILNYFQRDLFDYAGGAGGELDVFGFPFARGRIFTTQEVDISQFNSIADIFWASGTAMVVRKNIFLKAGGFDELFFAHMEEIDLCWRFHLMGYTVRSAPDSLVFHKNAVTLPMYTTKKYYLNHRNSFMMLLSNYSLPIALYVFPLRLALEGLAFIYALIKLDWKHMAAIIKSQIWLIFHPHKIVGKRQSVKSIRKTRDKHVLNKMYKGSVVLSYYLFGKKTYRDIVSNPDR